MKQTSANKRRGNRKAANKVPTDIARFTRLGKQVYGFPPSLYTRMRYTDVYTISSASGAVGKQTMLINSMFDPDSTGVGHQPLYRDTFAALYNHYSVVDAHVKVTYVSNTAGIPMLIGAVFDDDTTTSTTYYVLMESSKGVSTLVAGSTGSLSRETLQLDWSAKETLSIDPFHSEEYKTPAGSNPTEQTGLLIWACSADLTSSSTVSVMVEIDYHVLWSELQTQIGS